ncbi:MAG: redoxin domain-containing protein [Solobacterium sp.]|nr:redoxin domain-containing protein [Solobacterium sp.]
MNGTVSMGGVFLEGLLSFFTPCVLPLIPLYVGYLTTGSITTDEEGKVHYDRKKTFLSTLFFVLGICSVFFLMAAGTGAVHDFFQKYDLQLQLLGGFLLVVMGLTSFGVIQVPFLMREHRFSLKQNRTGLLGAWLMGFFFSFAWSPCIGPLLASAIMTAAQAETAVQGYMYIGAYTIGFIIMFLALGLFTEEVLAFIQKNRNIVKYTEKLGGAVVVGMGCWMLHQAFGTISILQNRTNEPVADISPEQADTAVVDGTDAEKYGFALPNAEGETIRLTDYTGKAVVVNFFGTWCTYCNLEMPHLQELEETRDDVKILLIATPNAGDEKDEEYIENYMSEHGYTMEVLYDRTLQVTQEYGVSGYPTTYIVKPDGNFLGYVPGYADKEALDHYLEMAYE